MGPTVHNKIELIICEYIVYRLPHSLTDLKLTIPKLSFLYIISARIFTKQGQGQIQGGVLRQWCTPGKFLHLCLHLRCFEFRNVITHFLWEEKIFFFWKCTFFFILQTFWHSLKFLTRKANKLINKIYFAHILHAPAVMVPIFGRIFRTIGFKNPNLHAYLSC